MILCNDSSCKDGVEIGDPTETALINFGTKLGIDTDKVRKISLEFLRYHSIQTESLCQLCTLSMAKRCFM